MIVDTIKAKSLQLGPSVIRHPEGLRDNAKGQARASFDLGHRMWHTKITSSRFLADHCYSQAIDCKRQRSEPLPRYAVNRHSER